MLEYYFLKYALSLLSRITTYRKFTKDGIIIMKGNSLIRTDSTLGKEKDLNRFLKRGALYASAYWCGMNIMKSVY